MLTAPIILFTYNRLKHTRDTVDALRENKLAVDSQLIIFSDAPANEMQKKNVNEVRAFLRTITGFKNTLIIERKSNFGLGENIINGVTQIINDFGKAIILEDDLITSPYFLQYMNDALDIYENKEKVVSVHGYTYPVKQKLPETFFLRGADCLGWGTWKRGWDKFEWNGSVLLEHINKHNLIQAFDFNNAYPFGQMLRDQINGKNNSWAIRWYASAFIKDLYTLYPGRSLVFHAGGDGSGSNTGYDYMLDVTLSNNPINMKAIPVEQNELAYKAFSKFLHKMNDPSAIYRVKRAWKKIITRSKTKRK